MTIVSLNVCRGKFLKSLEFFVRYSHVDVFLLQEVLHQAKSFRNTLKYKGKANVFDEIKETLKDHNGYFRPSQDNEWGLAIFVKKSLIVMGECDFFVHRFPNAIINNDLSTAGRNLQYVKVKINDKELTIWNFHGLWIKDCKTDSPERIEQSSKIISLFKNFGQEFVFAGDFNLLPNTISLQMFADFGLRNLITEHKIRSTRTSYYKKTEKYADYIFLTQKILSVKFCVLKDKISDHSPLFLECIY